MSDVNISQLPDNFPEIFVAAWANGRGFETSIVHGFPAALRHGQTDDWEYFAQDPSDDDFTKLASVTIESKPRMLTIITNKIDLYRNLAEKNGLEVLVDVETVMIRELPSQQANQAFLRTDEGFTSEFEHEDGYSKLKVKFDGKLAASGQVAVRDGFAIFDRITTEPDFRRRGLGSRIMDELSGRSRDLGAKTGVLLASVDGQHLYKRLGWDTASQVLILGNRAGNPMVKN